LPAKCVHLGCRFCGVPPDPAGNHSLASLPSQEHLYAGGNVRLHAIAAERSQIFGCLCTFAPSSTIRQVSISMRSRIDRLKVKTAARYEPPASIAAYAWSE
jgi:hypothetical protein